MDKWFMMQATMHRLPGSEPVLARVERLMRHPGWSASNPNKVRSLLTAFCTGNLAEFHRDDGLGYRLWTDTVLPLDAVNPQVAARLPPAPGPPPANCRFPPARHRRRPPGEARSCPLSPRPPPRWGGRPRQGSRSRRSRRGPHHRR